MSRSAKRCPCATSSAMKISQPSTSNVLPAGINFFTTATLSDVLTAMANSRNSRRGIGHLQWERKILDSIAIADRLDHLPDEFLVVGQQPRFHFPSKNVTQHTAEVFMPRKRHERSR